MAKPETIKLTTTLAEKTYVLGILSFNTKKEEFSGFSIIFTLYHSGKISVLLAKKNLSGFSDRKQVHIAIWAYFRSLNRADFSKPKVHLFFPEWY